MVASGKPKNAIAFTQPNWVALRPNLSPSSVKMPARIANVMAVTVSAIQHMLKSLDICSFEICIAGASIVELLILHFLLLFYV
jgi:hypothetical protein